MEFFWLRPMALFGCAFFLSAFFASFFAPIWAILFAAVFAIAVIAVLLIFRRPEDIEVRQTKLALVSLLLAPVLSLSLFAVREYRAENAVPFGREIAFSGTVRERLGSSSGYALYLIDVRSADGEKTSFSASIGCGDVSFAPGDVVEARGAFAEIGTSFPDGVRYLRSRKAVAEAEASSISLVGTDSSLIYRVASFRGKISARISMYAGRNAPFISALTIGDRSALDPALRRSFSELGVSHLLAISGIHMSVLFSAVTFLARPFGRHRFFLLVPAIFGYVALTGFAASTVRAGTMLAVIAFAGLFQLTTDRVTILSLALVLITVFSPGAIWDVGFLLSSLSVFALALLPIHRDGENRGRVVTVLRAVGVSFAATAAVSLVTLPVTAIEYGALSLAAPVANLIFIPAISVILFAAPLFLLSTFVPVIASAFGGTLDLYSELICRLARLLSGGGRFLVSLSYPLFGVLSVLLAVSFAAVCVSQRRRAPILCAALVASAMVVSGAASEAARADEVRVDAFAASSGDVITITDASTLFVVDCAKGSSALIRDIKDAMRERSATQIEKYVFTHYHADSEVYLQKLLAAVRVREVVLPAPHIGERDICLRMAQTALKADARPTLAEGDIELGEAKLRLSERSEIPKSAESAFALTVSLEDDGVTYVSAGFPDAPDECAGTLVVGTHAARSGGEIPEGADVNLADGAFSAIWKKK